MADAEYFGRWLSDLIAQTRGFRRTGDRHYDFGQVNGWRAAAEQCLSELLGTTSPYYKRFAEASAKDTNGYAPLVETNVEIVKGVLADLGAGRFAAVFRPPEAEVSRFGKADHVFQRFDLIVRQLRRRYNNRATLDVADEYDVQDLLHALLQLYFDDVRPEEWTPSYAGKSARMDFLVKAEQTVIETKVARRGLSEKELGDELIVDIERYQVHPDCKRLICFVYDPQGYVRNPRGIEADLSGTRGSVHVTVMIRP